jgi:HD-like signal output (HDOD) protein
MIRNRHLDDGIRDFCTSRLSGLISQGLDPLPTCLFELESLLNADVVNLEKINQILSSNVRFSRRILGLANKILAESNESARSVSDAVVLLGPSLFHSVILVCAITQLGDYDARDENAKAIWSHGIQVALASEGAAREAQYPFCGVAFTAGLVHDIGHVPLLLVACQQTKMLEELSTVRWQDNIEFERHIFGLDHCQVGKWMAKTWKFSDSIMDAIVHHHDPRAALVDPRLTDIVNAAETSCEGSHRIHVVQSSNIPPQLSGSVVH